MRISRRSFLLVFPATGVLSSSGGAPPPDAQGSGAIPAAFPAHDPAVAREIVTVAHGNTARVKEMLAGRPALANAAWDWGYGDWESPLGAASHIGNKEIAQVLISAGARPTIFSAAMLGQLDVVRAFVAASPGIQRTRGPHGLTLLSHATAGEAAEVVKYLEALGDADIRYTNEPVSEADRHAIVGAYTFGPGVTERLIVSETPRSGLVVKREGGVERNLFHLGGRMFHPSGAPAVRLRFAPGVRAEMVTIEDGDLVVTGRRSPV